MTNESHTPAWKRALGILAYTTVCTAAVIGGSVYGWISQSKIASAVTAQTLKNTTPEQVFHENSVTLLILGCDQDLSRGGKKVLRKNARSDMMLVAKLDFDSNRISGISIPRDTEVDLPGYRPQKINAYHAIGGETDGKRLARLAAESVVGVPIDRVLVLDYEAFQDLVNLIGGVEVFIARRLKYTDKAGGLFIDLKPGRQKLDGYDAMCYVRHRHDDSDFKRQERQKEFLLAFKDTVIQNWGMLPKVIDAAGEVVGDDLTPDEMAALARFAQRVGSDNIKMAMVPTVEGRGTNLQVDQAKLDDVLVDVHLKPETVAQLNRRS